MIWGALISPLANLASTFLEGRLATSKANNEVKVAEAKAKATIMQKQATGEIDWDLEAIKGSQNSWKDEWLVILFSIPLILAFIPGGEEIVQNGFTQLEKMPEWYQYSLGVIIAASFGVRGATKFFGKK
jgi:ABC-type multidrug transport system permease subunit